MALQGVQMPSIAGVYGVKDFREDLRPDGGLGKLAQMAMNLYQFKSGQAQQKEMQDAAQQFQAHQGELQRNWQQNQKKEDQEFQRNLQEAKWAQDAALMDKQQQLQSQKELAAFNTKFNTITNKDVNINNADALRMYKNELNSVLNDPNITEGQAEHITKMMGSIDDQLVKIETDAATIKAHDDAKAGMKDMISNASPVDAAAYLEQNKGLFTEAEYKQYSDMIREASKRRWRQGVSDAKTASENKPRRH